VISRKGEETVKGVSNNKMKKRLKKNQKIIIKIFLLFSVFLINPWIEVSAVDDTTGKRNIENATVEGLYNYPFTGSYIKPDTIVVKYEGEVLVEKTDYTISFSGFYGPGTITVTIKGKNNYEGTLIQEYEIIRNTDYILKMNKPVLSLSLQGMQTLSLYTTPSVYINPSKIQWQSSNPMIVSVDENGNLTPIGLGDATITATFNGQSVTSQVTVVEYLKGDINKDGKVNLKDVMEVIYFYTKKKTPTEESYLLGDMNGDGKLNLKDATPILEIYLKK